MKCGTYEGDTNEMDARLVEIKKRCKEKRICYKDEPYAVVHCTGYIRVRLYQWFPSQLKHLNVCLTDKMLRSYFGKGTRNLVCVLQKSLFRLLEAGVFKGYLLYKINL